MEASVWPPQPLLTRKYSRGGSHCKSFLLLLEKEKTVQREAKRKKQPDQQESRRDCTPQKQKKLGEGV